MKSPLSTLDLTSYVADTYDDSPARHGPGLPAAQEPGPMPEFPAQFRQAHVFYPEATEDRCTAALLLDVDPVAMVRGRGGVSQTVLAQYVNDRPYVASSFMSVAIAQVLGPALDGRSKERPELASTPIPLVATHRSAALPGRRGLSCTRSSSRSATRSRPSAIRWTRSLPTGGRVPTTR